MCVCIFGQAESTPSVQNSSIPEYVHGLNMICVKKLSFKGLQGKLQSREKLVNAIGDYTSMPNSVFYWQLIQTSISYAELYWAIPVYKDTPPMGGL